MCIRDRFSDAEALLSKAEMAGADRNLLIAARVILYAEQGLREQCVDAAAHLPDSQNSQDIFSQAFIARAIVSESPEEELLWLKKAENAGCSRTVLRGIAAAYVQIAQEETTYGQSLLALDCAVEKYEALINYPYPSFADRLNYAIVLRMSNKNREAKALLEALKSEYGDDYRVLIQLAFVCHELGETTNSAEYCESGYEAWKKIPNRQSSESETMQDFFALAERYGIREDEP